MRERVGRVSADGGGSPRNDLISGGSLFVVALAYGFGAGGLASAGAADVALVPIGLAAALAALSAGIAVSGWRKLRREGTAEASRTAHATIQDAVPTSTGLRSALGRLRTPRAGPIRAWTVIGLTILYAALFQTLGYVLATLLYTGAVAERFGARRRTILAIVPCVTLLTYLLFRVILGARLPAGLLG